MTTPSTSQTQPSLLGLQPSFGFGDRLGLATPGHIAACKLGRLKPIFAQQSVREMTRTDRTPADVMNAAQRGIAQECWTDAWGADADHLKTEQDVIALAAAGFTFFTIDPSEHVQNQADTLTGDALTKAAEAVVSSGAFTSLAEAESLYLGQTHELPESGSLSFGEMETLYRAIVKYGKAVAYSAQMAQWIEREAPGRSEIEVSVDETDTPTSPLEHLFIGLELKRRGVRAVGVAPRFIGDFEKGIDYKGDIAAFEEALKQHVAIAKYCGPYKISVHSGSDKFSIYPVIGRVCGDLLHVKTAGTSYLEALRVVARESPRLFGSILEFSRECFEKDRALTTSRRSSIRCRRRTPYRWRSGSASTSMKTPAGRCCTSPSARCSRVERRRSGRSGKAFSRHCSATRICTRRCSPPISGGTSAC
jgi:hypothetical protein